MGYLEGEDGDAAGALNDDGLAWNEWFMGVKCVPCLL